MADSTQPRRWEYHKGPNWLINRADQLAAEAGRDAQIVVVIRIGDRITIRDNSGIEGLCDQKLMDASLALLGITHKS
jgi:hypothetical protein